jgi:hypothetical protein
MSWRGLLVALLCGVLGIGLGIIAAYAAQPSTSSGGVANPISGVSPSVPIDVTPPPPKTSPDIDYPKLDPNLSLPQEYTIGNELATWTYHVPLGWQGYAVCAPGECPPPMATNSELTTRQVLRRPEVRFRPPDEPTVGGFSLRVKALDNTLGYNPGQLVGTKIVGFRQAYADDQFSLLKRTPSSAYFTYVDGNDHLRYNYFQWFAAEGSTVATLEMSVAGRKRDVKGLKNLFDRFADNVIGTTEPYQPPTAKKSNGAG